MGLSIDIAIEHEAWSALDALHERVDRAAAAALAEAGVALHDGTELSIVLCDDSFIQNLNRNWRGKDKATDVLSFPADPSARHVTMGDIVVAYETSAAEARSEDRALGDHLAHLVIHGTLHLLGYDHETDQEADTMERLERAALLRLGIVSPYEDATSLSPIP